MSTSRRHFLEFSAMAGAAASWGVGPNPLLATRSQHPTDAEATPHPLDILILGGTSFLGPHQIRYALERGHAVTIFTRGRTQPTIFKKLFRDVEHLVGDRSDDLSALRGRTWDAVIDNSGRPTPPTGFPTGRCASNGAARSWYRAKPPTRCSSSMFET